LDHWLAAEIRRMETDPDRAAQIGRAIGRTLSGDAMRGWVADVWEKLLTLIEQDVEYPEGRLELLARNAVGQLGRSLAAEPESRLIFERGFRGMIHTILPSVQTRLADYIAGVVTGWDAQALVERLETRIGPDLQWIRINGTIVGFLAGLALYAINLAFARSGS
jgi:uncharacterized membrane-anchored protein YjiN (DUF445 family)